MELRRVDRYLAVIMGLVFIAAVYVAWLLLHPAAVIEINNGSNEPSEILTPEIRAGERVEWKVNICKRKAVRSEINRTLVNHYVVFYETQHSNEPVGCKDLIVSQTVPPYVPTGNYKIRTTITYPVNSFRNEVVQYETENFKVNARIEDLDLEQSGGDTHDDPGV